MNSEFIMAIDQIEKEKSISKEYLLETIEISLVSACKKNFGTSQNIKVTIDRENGDVSVFAEKEVVEEVYDDALEITLDDAQKINFKYEIGDLVDITITPKNFGRIAAQTAKQVVVQKIREAERQMVYNKYSSKQKDIVTGIVQRFERKNVMVDLGKVESVLAPNEQAPGEVYKINQRIKVYVVDVKQNAKGPQVFVSRTHPELIKRLFEQEVPEIYEGIVEIKSIAREAGSRTKIAVYSNDKEVDPVGACVGQNGNRVNVIVSEIKGEKIDIILWNEEPKVFIAAALSPSQVVQVEINASEKSAKVVVPDYQLSLAIGKEGQNVRLAAKLTGYRIDIKSESQAKEVDFISSNKDCIEKLEDDDNINN